MEEKKGKEYIINKNSAERGGINKKHCDGNTFNFLISDTTVELEARGYFQHYSRHSDEGLR